MGGTVNVYIRDHERKFHKMRRWTNSLPNFTAFLNIASDEKKHLQMYMEPWHEMNADFQANRKTKQYKLPMTSAYFPLPSRINRSEYGMIFIDFITKKIISAQYYSSMNKIYQYSTEYLDEDLVKDLSKAASNSKLKYHSFFNDEIVTLSESDMINMMNTESNGYIEVDMTPWTVVEMRTNKTGEIVAEITKILNET